MLLNIGFGNVVVKDKIVAIVAADSAPMRRYRDEARKRGKLIDATQGRKTRSLVITGTDHVILSAVAIETISQRWQGAELRGQDGEERT